MKRLTRQEMENRWALLWLRAGVSDAGLAAAGADVMRAYDEPARRYHSGAHLSDVLTTLDWGRAALEASRETAHMQAEEKARMFDRIELALWYHDAVYDATKHDNEEQSAQLFLRHAQKFGLPEAVQKDVTRLIRLTAGHKKAASLDESIMADTDLAILGARTAAFRKYDADIRREYAHVPAKIFYPARRRILNGFRANTPVFKTSAFRAQFEARAHKNLKDATGLLARVRSFGR